AGRPFDEAAARSTRRRWPEAALSKAALPEAALPEAAPPEAGLPEAGLPEAAPRRPSRSASPLLCVGIRNNGPGSVRGFGRAARCRRGEWYTRGV
ncbi:MAG: hypothetical protein QOG96_1533, partial [Pseudonocardiales bacterium]|nr:hypothetical protein [Pseudonocardiales bacterium]